MIVEKAIWTALPFGLTAEKRLRLSVHVAPRLTTDDGDDSPRKLGEFSAFEAWAARIAEMTWRVEFSNGAEEEGHPLERPDPDLWARLFPPDTFVRPHAFKDHAKRSLHVFPVRDVLQFVEQAYGSLAAEGPDLPSIDGPNALTAAFGPLAGLLDQVGASKSFQNEIARAKDPIPPAERPDGVVVAESMGAGAASSLFQAYRFYYRPGPNLPVDPDYEEPPVDPPDLDFHDRVSLLADHPRLLRMLGLVVDLVVDLEEPHANIPATGLVRAVPEGELPEQPPRTPWTRYDLVDEWFGAKPKQDFVMERGLLRLTPEFWDLFQVDVDGAALQSVGFGDTLARLLKPEWRNHETPAETGAPALRSGGFSLARQGRGDSLLDALKGRRDLNALIESGATVAFDAEDLVRGYRVDVHDDNAPNGVRWFSLHDRIAQHLVGDPGAGEPLSLDPIRDEGYIKATTGSSERKEHDLPSEDLYLHEVVASWDGWSLAASRPGKRIVEPGEGEDAGASPLARHDPSAGQQWPLVSSVEVGPKSLPRLRTGHTYRLRMRTVDLAGNSLDFSETDLADPDSDLATEAQLAVRFEPVPSPTVLRQHLDTEGESLEHLVIRSNGGISAKDYAASPDVTKALVDAGAAHDYAADSRRHLAPPKGSMQMAEIDGRFDTGSSTANLRVALREEGTFLDEKIVDVGTGQKTINQAAIKLHPPSAQLPKRRGSGLSGSEPDFDKKLDGPYAYYPDPVTLPYLSDPLAIGIRLIGLDYDGIQVLDHFEPFEGTWPSLVPLRIRLVEEGGLDPVVAPAADGVLEVRLPKARVVRAKLSSVFPDGRLDDFAIWDWTPGPDQTPDLKQAMLAGRHWMLTPWRWLTFTHAVQQPLEVPVSNKLALWRALGETFARFDGTIKNNARSTGRLDVFANWTEDVDLITDPAPRMARTESAVPHVAQAFGFDIGPGEDSAKVTLPGGPPFRESRHEFGDTKYRRVVYHAVATTRFREYLPPPIAADLLKIQRSEIWNDGSEGPEHWLDPLVRDVLSAARPAAPELVQTLPTFRWERDDASPVRKHVRRGKAVRVWLRRPWFSSGDGEQLGVVLEPATRLRPGWVSPLDIIDQASAGFAAAAGPSTGARQIASGRKPRLARRTAISTTDRLVTRASLGATRVTRAPAGGGAAGVKGQFTVGPISGLFPTPTPEEIHRMLGPYVTRWGNDPVWASRLPELPPIMADFPKRISQATDLTLEEVAPQARVNVAGHEVHFDADDRRLWYSDIEVENGDAYYPFVRLALARYQPHSLNGAHLSRVVMTDFMQLAPDRTAEVELGPDAAGITVRGYAGENILSKMWSPMFPDILFGTDKPAPNTAMRAVLQRRPKDVPGDLGWEAAGPEITLSAKANGFHVTWVGQLPLAAVGEDGDRRILITEIETFPRDMLPSDPPYMTSPRDHVRERIVYADVFEL